MKIIISILINILLTSYAFAEDYKLENSKPNAQVDNYLFSQQMTDFNLFPVDTTHLGSLLQNDVDQIFLDRNNYDNYAVLKFNLRYLGKQGLFKISDTDYACHGSFINERSFTLFTTGLSQDTVEKICNNMNLAKNDVKQDYFSKLHLINSLLNNPAQAQDSECCKKTVVPKEIQAIKNVSQFFSAEVIVQKIGSCLSNVLRGSGNVFTGIFDSAKSLFTTSPKELWNGLKSKVANIKNFVLNIKDQMIKLKDSFSQLDSDLILTIGCQLAGEIITSAGITALTGAGAAMLSARVIQIISKMSKLNHLFTRLNKLSRIGNKKLAQKVLGCGLK